MDKMLCSKCRGAEMIFNEGVKAYCCKCRQYLGLRGTFKEIQNDKSKI